MSNIVDYYDAGMRVFALHSIKNGLCDCGNPQCNAVGKHPTVKCWNDTPYWSQEQFDCILRSGQVETGFGVICDGYLVIDVDPRNGGDISFNNLCKDLGIDIREECKFIVSTGGGGHHYYFKLNEDKKLKQHLVKYHGIDFKTSGFVVGSSSLHASGLCYETEKGSPDEIAVAPEKLVSLLKKGDIVLSKVNGNEVIDLLEIDKMLDVIPSHEYQTWVEIGMALKFELADDGFDIWKKWSKKASNCVESELLYKWSTFNRTDLESQISVGTIKHYAYHYSYTPEIIIDENILDLDSSEIPDYDVHNLSGLLKDVRDYITRCSRYERENLILSSAIAVVSSVGGLNVEDVDYQVVPNVIVFNVAGSGTGKENIQQAIRRLITAAGAVGCVFGAIKSEQELVRCMCDHQLTVYVIDEFGHVLKKINNGGKSGAHYLDGIISTIMSLFSKADGVFGITRDKVVELVEEYTKKITSVSEDDLLREDKLDIYTTMLNMIDENCGFVNQYLNIVGFTTPKIFNSLVDFENSTNGFFGRAIIFEDKDTNPRMKPDFKPDKTIPDYLKNKLQSLFSNGCANIIKRHKIRIIESKNKTKITTHPDAKKMLSRIYDFYHEWGDREMESSGLEALTRRAYEQILKLSLIAAMSDGVVRNVNHVLWAHSLVKQELQNKILIVSSNMAKEDKNHNDEIVSRVLHALDKKTPKTARTINRSMRKFNAETVKKTLDELVLLKKVKIIDSSKSTKYILA